MVLLKPAIVKKKLPFFQKGASSLFFAKFDRKCSEEYGKE